MKSNLRNIIKVKNTIRSDRIYNQKKRLDDEGEIFFFKGILIKGIEFGSTERLLQVFLKLTVPILC